MKNIITYCMTAAMLLVLVACKVSAPAPDSSIPDVSTDVSIIDAEVETTEPTFPVSLIPVRYREDEPIRSMYYKSVSVEDEMHYEVLSADNEAFTIPVSKTVIYGIADADACKLDMIEEALPNGDVITQYELYVILEGDAA